MWKKINLKKSDLIKLAVLAVILGAAGWGIFRYGFVAKVNGEYLSRWSYYQALDRQYGQQIKEKMIQDRLVLQEARKKGVNISDQEIEDEIKKIEERLKASNMTLDQAMAAQGMTRVVLVEQIRMQKLVDKLSATDIKIDPKDIDDFLKQNKAMLPQGKTTEELRQLAEEELKSQQQSDTARQWYAGIRSAAEIIYR